MIISIDTISTSYFFDGIYYYFVFKLNDNISKFDYDYYTTRTYIYEQLYKLIFKK